MKFSLGLMFLPPDQYIPLAECAEENGWDSVNVCDGLFFFEKTSVDAGMESVTDAQWQLAESVLLVTKLEIFAPLADLDLTTIRSDTNLTFKVNQYITTNLNLQIVDDEKASDQTQVKEALALGLSYAFL